MKKLFFGVLMMVSTLIFAQSGKVVDKTGEPQAFCKVTAPELNLVTYTDFDGLYEIDVPEGTKLVFDYVSYETLEVISKDSMEVTLKDPEINFPSTIQ